MGLDQQDSFEIGDPFPIMQKKDKRITRRIVQSDPVYAAMIKALDDSVGQLRATLKAEALDEDTIVIFTSDNGGLATAEHSPTCNFPLSEGKDGCTRARCGNRYLCAGRGRLRREV